VASSLHFKRLFLRDSINRWRMNEQAVEDWELRTLSHYSQQNKLPKSFSSKSSKKQPGAILATCPLLSPLPLPSTSPDMISSAATLAQQTSAIMNSLKSGGGGGMLRPE
jgi:hypothetical protein